ncbi:GNAT family N-acetyltransferase [Denitrobaculum tricleocarpae]|uniref:GNAT family N-acetyltransferase n=1 Tax=Denitrobaculum tricleocarpae TaxID=2591009 RepID=A0A545TL40_9PROT|nr:GNAT family N-acetyltransferase [Denitrobaculum tricleocarpae]TQV77881.1 GNAT family N-acetyltransferase [Denitrobaculum tricleocarpae]
MTELIIKPASVAEFAAAVDWAAAEGWNPGLDDLEVFNATDPQGFLMGWLDGKAVSSISVVRYGPDFGFLGFYIVHPDHRGTGAGLATWNAGMAFLADRVVGLDGVVDQQENYRRSGFEFEGRNVRLTGVPALSGIEEASSDVRDVSPADETALLAYDRPFFPDARDIFTRSWVRPGSSASRTSKLALRDGEIIGYGVARACRSGYKIGPLFAEDDQTARNLFIALCKDLPLEGSAGGEVSLDVPESNRAAVALAEDFGLRQVFETARMYRGTIPALPWQKTFGLTSFELG